MKARTLVVPELNFGPLRRSLPRIEDIVLPRDYYAATEKNDRKTVVQIQVALVQIAKQLGYRTWIGRKDRGIVYKNLTMGEMESVIATLEDVNLMNVAAEARAAANFIDCIWFKNGKLMPAVIEVEHSTRVTRGLARMKKLQDIIPAFRTRYVIAAADEDRELVMRECSLPQFSSLQTKFLPYSAVEELRWLSGRRKLQGAVTDEFLDSYMEPCLPLLS